MLAYDKEFKTKKLVIEHDGVKVYKREGKKWVPYKGRSQDAKHKIQEFNDEFEKAKIVYDYSFTQK